MRTTKLSSEETSNIKELIKEAEQSTAAEIVVVVAGASSDYREVDHRIAATLTLIVLGIALNSLFYIDPLLIPLELTLLYLGVLLVAPRWEWKRYLISDSFAKQVVLQSARAAFAERGVGLTPSRMGVLIYISLLERRAELILDVGAANAIPPELRLYLERKLLEITKRHIGFEAVSLCISEAKMLFERYLPAGQINHNELSDSVHIV